MHRTIVVTLLKMTYSGYTLYGVGDGYGCQQWSRKIVVTLLKPTYSGYTLYDVGDGYGCYHWSRDCLPFRSTEFTPSC